MKYQFMDKEFLVDGEGKMNVPYTKIKRLVEDNDYLYIFLGKKSLFMVSKKDVTLNNNSDTNNLNNLMEIISRQSNLPWERVSTMLFINLNKLKRAFSDLKEQ